jgi:endo-1,4-beta-D-glucanase Y
MSPICNCLLNRAALPGLLAALASAPASAQNRPFPQHTAYTAGTIKPNHVTQVQMDASVRGKWDSWRNAYLRPALSGQYYVRYNSAGETVSEAHGYGMLLTVLMAGYDASAKTYFDGLYNYYRAHPSNGNQYLMAWKQNSSFQSIEGVNSATDGDLDIAYALLLADKQWGSAGAVNYLQAATDCINAIMAKEVNQTYFTLRLGDWATSGAYATSTRPSDFMLQHMKAYQTATGDAKWTSVTNKTYEIINTIFAGYSPNTGLLPDFVIRSNNAYQPAGAGFLEGPNDGKYYYNSCRVPWRITTDYLITGDTRALDLLRKLNSWIRAAAGNNVANIYPGYGLDGSTINTSYTDNSFTIPFGVSAMTDAANQTWLNSIWSRAASSGNNGYYPDSIKLISMIVMSGNWWSPDATSANTPPTITAIADQSIGVNTATGALSFTIGDAETAAGSLTLAKNSSNTTLVPLSGVAFDGVGPNRSVTVTPAANQTGAATITVTVGDGELTAGRTFAVTVTATPSESWRIRHFHTSSNLGNAADDADPDFDGVLNLLEFALDGDPNACHLAILPVSAREGGDLTLTYTRRKDASGELVFAVEAAPDPGGLWSVTDVIEQILSDDGTLQTVQARVAIGSSRQKFLRLKVTRP